MRNDDCGLFDLAVNMVRRYPFCGNCGTAYASEGDQCCRSCGQSVTTTRTAPRSAAYRWNWRFLLVTPAFLVGIIVPGMLVRISTEIILFVPMAEFGQSMVDGACAVLFPRAVAPHHKMGISITAGILVMVISVFYFASSFLFTNYYEAGVGKYAGVGKATVVWQVVLVLTMIAAAGIAVLYAHVQAKRAPVH